MITVKIFINDDLILSQSATRNKYVGNDKYLYWCDDGTLIEHDPRKGAAELAKKMLGTELKKSKKCKE